MRVEVLKDHLDALPRVTLAGRATRRLPGRATLT
jgi:hypothetical protein